MNGWYCRDTYDVDTNMSCIECATEENGHAQVYLEGKSLTDYEVENEETGECRIDDDALENDIENEWC